ncbi:Hypothetical protein, putative [Bodo saltans]|uniref:Uncharacterized protein n=1 Tax=Bodo saltans TaxID=75058 RepID=A0A0S4KM78_BODSA|nr:Hypothetical protein, putative [Bodo saltans]|eukprot:CUI15486.1 Hypothetical protein, putative [Bodo saltans]
MNDDNENVETISVSVESPLLGRTARRNAPAATWIVASDLLDVGATAANNHSSSSIHKVTEPFHQPALPSQEESQTLARVVCGYQARKLLASQQQQANRNLRDVRNLASRISLIDTKILKNAYELLRRFSKRWRAWASGRASRERHENWLLSEGRTPLTSFEFPSDTIDWGRNRSIVSWTYYTAAPSPFLPMHPIQRWLAGAHTAACLQTRKLQKLWRRTQFRKAAFRLRGRVVAERTALQFRAFYVSRCAAVDESREWFEVCRLKTDSEELLGRAQLVHQFGTAKSHLLQRMKFQNDESARRHLDMVVLWEQWESEIRTGQQEVACWREANMRQLLRVRSLMKLEALYKEFWFGQYQDAMVRWFESSANAVIAIASNSMILGPADLIDHRSPFSRDGAKTVSGKLLSSMASIEALNELVDQWYMRLKHDETTEVGAIVDRCARVTLRNRLLIDRPYETLLQDQERRYRSILVKHMIKGSLLKQTRPSALSLAAPEISIHSQHSKVEADDFGVPVSNPTTPGWSEGNITTTHSDNISYGFAISGRSELRDGIAAHPPTQPAARPRPLRLGRDGFRTGVSKELQRAMSGCRDSHKRQRSPSVYK